MLGLSEVPLAGAEFIVCENEREAREIAQAREQERMLQQHSDSTPKRATLEDLMRATAAGERKELNIVLKCDVQGSLEALNYSLSNIKSDKVSLSIVYAGIGNITVNDVQLAKASNAIVVGFHVGKETEVNAVAKREGVEIRLYAIIYELIDEVKAAMAGLLDPILRETALGTAEVRQVFDMGKKGKVAGCIVKGGRVTNRSRIRVKRKGEVLHVGNITTLRRFQEDAAQVRDGQECGIRIDTFGDYQPGDILEAYEVEKITQQL
jgi:translation initiation factor IF-2